MQRARSWRLKRRSSRTAVTNSNYSAGLWLDLGRSWQVQTVEPTSTWDCCIPVHSRRSQNFLQTGCHQWALQLLILVYPKHESNTIGAAIGAFQFWRRGRITIMIRWFRYLNILSPTFRGWHWRAANCRHCRESLSSMVNHYGNFNGDSWWLMAVNDG